MQAAGHPLTPTRRQGEVISYSATPAPTVEVKVADDPSVTHFMPFLDSYFPVVGDYVVLLENQGDYVCIGSDAGATPKRCGVTVSYSDSYTSDGLRTIAGTWTYGETVGGFAAGATTGNSTPVVVPASAGGLYAVTHESALTVNGITRVYVSVVVGGTMTPSNLRSEYRAPYEATAFDANGTASAVIPLSAAQTVQAVVYIASGNTAKTLAGTLTCYRVGS